MTDIERRGCRKCGAPPVADPRASGWGDGGTICPTCRADRNARARQSATRIVAHAALAVMGSHPGSKLATVRRLPGMETLRAIPFWGEDALAPSLADVWADVREGSYLVTVDSPGEEPEHFAVDVSRGVLTGIEAVTSEEAARLPAVLRDMAWKPDRYIEIAEREP